MIECEFKCIKEWGSNADLRVRSEHATEDFDVCFNCLDILQSMGTVEILEEY